MHGNSNRLFLKKITKIRKVPKNLPVSICYSIHIFETKEKHRGNLSNDKNFVIILEWKICVCQLTSLHEPSSLAASTVLTISLHQKPSLTNFTSIPLHFCINWTVHLMKNPHEQPSSATLDSNIISSPHQDFHHQPSENLLQNSCTTCSWATSSHYYSFFYTHRVCV